MRKLCQGSFILCNNCCTLRQKFQCYCIAVSHENWLHFFNLGQKVINISALQCNYYVIWTDLEVCLIKSKKIEDVTILVALHCQATAFDWHLPLNVIPKLLLEAVIKSVVCVSWSKILMTKNVLDTAKDWGRVSSRKLGWGLSFWEILSRHFKIFLNTVQLKLAWVCSNHNFPLQAENLVKFQYRELTSINLNFHQFFAKIAIFQLELLYKIIIT